MVEDNPEVLGPVDPNIRYDGEIESIFIDNQEVQSIIEKDTGGILFQKSNDIENLPVMTLTVTGSSFETYSSTPFTYTGEVFVDWGDNTGLVEYTDGKLSHSFTDGVSSHTIRVYGNLTSLESDCFSQCTNLISITLPDSIISLKDSCLTRTNLTSILIPDGVTSLGKACFSECTGLTQITLPDSITGIGLACFYSCTSLTSIHLNWIGTEILTYQSHWIQSANSTLKFIIPYGTTQLYIDKGYPSSKLEEEIPFNNVVLSADKSVLSYYHNDSCTLTAQLMYDNTPINIAGVTVTFATQGVGLGTAQTNASGFATMSYTIEKEPTLGLDTYTYITATAENFSSDEYEIENCLYAPSQQYDITKNSTTVITKLNNDIITNLPSSYTIEFDMKSSNNPTSNAEQRIYWAPNNLWTGTGQPSLAAFAGYCYSSKLEAGRRLNAQTAETNSKTVTPTQWSHIKIDKRADQTYHFFYNDEENEYSYWTLSEGENYTDWIFGIILWSNTTFSIKNLKIKSTVPKVKVDDDDPIGEEIS